MEIELHEKEELEKELNIVTEKIHELYLKREAVLKETKGRFNVFTTLLQSHDEVRLHTRFLTHLLDPNGVHDCGKLFLNSFLRTVGLNNNEEFGECRYANNEHCAGKSGNIDMYIEFENSILVIENKILAGDQDRQLERYYEYSSKGNKRVYVFYLTLDGHEPSKQSAGELNKAKKTSELGENNYYCISYQYHIRKWLEDCLKASFKYININQVIQQYKDVVNQLTNNTFEERSMEEVYKIIFENNSILKYRNIINKAIDERKEIIIYDFIKRINSFLSDYSFVSDGNSFKLQTADGLDHPNSSPVLIEWEGPQTLFIGCVLQGTKESKAAFQEKYEDQLYNIFSDAVTNDNLKKYGKQNEWWPAGTFVLKPNFTSDDYLHSLLNDETLAKEASGISVKIKSFIEIVNKHWVN